MNLYKELKAKYDVYGKEFNPDDVSKYEISICDNVKGRKVKEFEVDNITDLLTNIRKYVVRSKTEEVFMHVFLTSKKGISLIGIHGRRNRQSVLEEYSDAKKIATLIRETPTENRGDLFLEVSKKLTRDGQNFTSSLLLLIANKYGFKK